MMKKDIIVFVLIGFLFLLQFMGTGFVVQKQQHSISQLSQQIKEQRRKDSQQQGNLFFYTQQDISDLDSRIKKLEKSLQVDSK